MTTASNIGIGATNITTLGTIVTGVWNGTAVTGTYGGTGVNNGASTFTIGGNVTFSGAYTFAGTLTNNTSVTFPTSGTLSTAGGTSPLVPLATLTASSSASLAFTSLFSSSYYQYLIIFTNILPATDNTKLYLVAGTGATPTYVSTGYLWQLQGGYAAGNNQSGAGNSNDAQAVLAFLDGSGVSNSATYNGVSGFMYISAIGGSSQTMTGVGHLGYETTSEGWCIQQNSFNLPAASYTALKFLFSAGNIASGTIDIYGLAAG